MSSTRTGSETGNGAAANFAGNLPTNRHALDWVRVLRFATPTVGLAIVLSGLISLTLGAGCAGKKAAGDAPTANLSANAPASDAPQPSALQVSPPTTPAAPAPVVTQTPTPASVPGATTDVSSAGSTYTVQHGDTLFGIAKQHYGDGKQWTRIVSANPGLTPATLKAGQKIVLP